MVKGRQQYKINAKNWNEHEMTNFTKSEPCYTYRFCYTKPKMSPFKTQNDLSKYIERSSGKTRLSNQLRHLRLVKWKYTACEKIGVKVDWFLKIVWTISNLDKSMCLICKITNFLKVILYSYLILKKMNERITDS